MKNETIEKSIRVFGTQKRLAKKAGISQSAIHKQLHSLTGDMYVSTMLRLSDATGIPLEEYLKQVRAGMSEKTSNKSSCTGS